MLEPPERCIEVAHLGFESVVEQTFRFHRCTVKLRFASKAEAHLRLQFHSAFAHPHQRVPAHRSACARRRRPLVSRPVAALLPYTQPSSCDLCHLHGMDTS